MKSVPYENLLIEATEDGRYYSISYETPAFIDNVNILDDNILNISLKNRLITQVNIISLMLATITKSLVNFLFSLINNFIANTTSDFIDTKTEYLVNNPVYLDKISDDDSISVFNLEDYNANGKIYI
jgi:hypothetical protein